jgi:glycosyltransferase involved in cell wall biosynthesis
MADNKCVVVILTFNSAGIIRETVSRAKLVSPFVFVVDSGSKDGTLDIISSLDCEVVHRDFLNYSDQRNWAIDQVAGKYDWQLHLDADEVLDDLAVREITTIVTGSTGSPCYLIRRRDYFMGKPLKFSGLNPWHLRLFRSGQGRCENRLYDQHFVSHAPAQHLSGLMHDKNSASLTAWVASHNRWSDLEAKEILSRGQTGQTGVLEARFFGDPRERVRFLKKLYYRLPSVARAVLYFFYRYFVRLGFLDGKVGFYYAFFQALWFRMLVDAKVSELLENNKSLMK